MPGAPLGHELLLKPSEVGGVGGLLSARASWECRRLAQEGQAARPITAPCPRLLA